MVGAGGEGALRELAGVIDRRPLLIHHGEDTVWAWLGGGREVDADEMERLAVSRWPGEARVAIGEPGEGLRGWRLTHRQAAAALPVALRGPDTHVRYGEVAVIASLLQDEILTSSLRDLYLAPLSYGHDEGETLRETLRAYLDAERNVSSAAIALGVNRNTVTNRLRAVEQRLGRPLGACVAELEAALRLEELSDVSAVRRASE